MTEIYGLFDAADPTDPDRVYTSEAFARLFRTMMRDGIVHNDGDELAVSPTVPAAMSVSVGTGMALVQGRYYINSADLTLTVEAADPSYPRIDRVVVRLNASPGRTIDILVKKGTAAASPVPPGLTRTPETWELSLAQIRVEAGATSILSEKITDERGDASLCGVACPVYVPSSQVEAVGAINMQGHALTGLPAPSGSTDAARKGYVDAEIAGKIGGFGISQIAIDADKDWNGKSITNLDYIEANRIRPVASNEVRWAKSGSCSVTIPAIYISGTVQISMSVLGYWDGDWWYSRSGTLSIDGVAKKTISAEGATNTHTGVYAVSGGSIVSFSGSGVGAVSISCSDTFPIIYPPAATWPS